MSGVETLFRGVGVFCFGSDKPRVSIARAGLVVFLCATLTWIASSEGYRCLAQFLWMERGDGAALDRRCGRHIPVTGGLKSV